jgi:hypothetical protein
MHAYQDLLTGMSGACSHERGRRPSSRPPSYVARAVHARWGSDVNCLSQPFSMRQLCGSAIHPCLSMCTPASALVTWTVGTGIRHTAGKADSCQWRVLRNGNTTGTSHVVVGRVQSAVIRRQLFSNNNELDDWRGSLHCLVAVHSPGC